MEDQSEFKPQITDREQSGHQFRIEVADGHRARFLSINPLGQELYEIFDDDGVMGTVQLDERDHAHCDSQGCEIDLPLLQSIRDQIRFHQELKKTPI